MAVEFALDDAKGFDENIESFRAALIAIDPSLGPILGERLISLTSESDKGDILDALVGALEESENQS